MSFSNVLCFSDLSYPSLWSILYDSDQKIPSGSFNGISTGALFVYHRFPSFSTRSCLRLAVAPHLFVGAIPWKRNGACQLRAPLERKLVKAASTIPVAGRGSLQPPYRAQRLVPTIPCLHSEFCVSPCFLHVSPTRTEAAVTHTGTTVPYLECSWLNFHLFAS